MCIFGKKQTTAGAPAIRPLQKQDTGLAKPKELVTEDTKPQVDFGSETAKETSTANRTGTDALKIDINANNQGQDSGGMNV